jgi:hypothetical protein
MLLMREALLFGGGPGRNSASAAIECNVGTVVHDHGAVHVNIGDLRCIHPHHRRVVKESAASPFAAVETVAAVSVPVIDAAVKSNLRTPIAGVP